MMSGEDIIVWADDTWCYRYELHEYMHMSDDYLVLPEGSAAWVAWVDNYDK